MQKTKRAKQQNKHTPQTKQHKSQAQKMKHIDTNKQQTTPKSKTTQQYN